MDRPTEERRRDRALWIVRLATLGSVTGALGMTWGFYNLSADYFSGKPAPAPTPPPVPVQGTPVQTAPTVVTTVVHHAAPVAARTPPPAEFRKQGITASDSRTPRSSLSSAVRRPDYSLYRISIWRPRQRL